MLQVWTVTEWTQQLLRRKTINIQLTLAVLGMDTRLTTFVLISRSLLTES